MGVHDAQQLKSEADILARAARPQRNSTWIPKTRDWRYATGVIRHDDYSDLPNARSTWDIIDYDYQTSGGRRNRGGLSRSRSGTVSEQESTESVPTPESTVLSSRSLIVRMRFSHRSLNILKEILEDKIVANPTMTPPYSPLFQRVWVDETHDFNMKHVRSTLRPADKVVDNLGSNYEWYDDAVPADALFPPGVPLSAKEIHAFYPHHVRWKSVMVRLTNNDYRGPDIVGMQAYFRGAPNHHTPPAYMNNYQRDLVKTVLPGFKTASYKGKSDRNLRTDEYKPGVYIESTRKGFSLPTFEELTLGLHRLPAGLDARGLTQCMSWYLNIRDSFTPKLQLNVLHTQSLIRALREPLKPFGPQNLDRNALEEWRSKGTFETAAIEQKEQPDRESSDVTVQQHRSQLHLDFDADDVSMAVTLPIRHVLTFPFLALHRVMSDALRLGIEKAEIRKAAREESAVMGKTSMNSAAKATSQVSSEAIDEQLDGPRGDRLSVQPAPEEPKQPYRITKRVRPEAAEELLSAPKKPRSQFPSAVSTGYRPLAPAPPRQNAAFGLGPTSFVHPPPPSASSPSRSAQDSVYGRRDFFADRQHEHRRGG